MLSKFTFGFLSSLGLVTIISLIVTTVKAAMPDPEALVAVLHSFSSQGLCHCAQQGYSIAIDESATGVCLPLPRNFQTVAVNTTQDWNVFVFNTANCSDEGGWLFPRTIEDPDVCNYSLGNASAYAVLGPNNAKYQVGARRGKIDQYCHVPHFVGK